MSVQAEFGTTRRDVFEQWLAARQDGAAVATAALISDHTMLVDAGWDGETHRLVARLEPAGQVETRCHYLTLRRLGTQVVRPTVPSALWCEDDAGLFGAPFVVMTRLNGLTTAKYQTPYTFASFITEATSAERDRMQWALLEQLARVHAATPSDFAFLDRRRRGESALQAHLRQTAARYASVSSRGLQAPLIERGFGWLRERWPAESVPVLCWGDARIDNAVYRDFSTVALTGWRHAALGPRELDLGSLVFRHRFADELAHSAAHAGLPDFLTSDHVAAAYAAITGHRPANLDFYVAYAALGNAIELLRSPLRTTAFKVLAEVLGDERSREEQTAEGEK